MGIIGIHTLIYTSEPEALRATLRDVFGWDHVDAGDGWLIFALPPAEMGVHPADAHGPGTPAGTQQLSIMCDDIEATLDELRGKGLEVTSGPNDEGFGITAFVALPGGVQMMVYEPRHPSPLT